MLERGGLRGIGRLLAYFHFIASRMVTLSQRSGRVEINDLAIQLKGRPARRDRAYRPGPALCL
jgi:hypothetical protein